MTQKIEEYVNEVYRQTKGNGKEIQELKLEMKNHLLETVQELQAEGKTEDQAVQIAKERFGEVTELRSLINQLFEGQKNFGKWLLAIGTALLLITVLAATFLIVNGNKQTAAQADIAYSISAIAGESTKLAEANEQEIAELLNQATYIKEVRIFTDASANEPYFTSNANSNTSSNLLSAEYSYGTDENFVVLKISDTRIIGLLILAMGLTGFVVLFLIWLTIHRYHAKKEK